MVRVELRTDNSHGSAGKFFCWRSALIWFESQEVVARLGTIRFLDFHHLTFWLQAKPAIISSATSVGVFVLTSILVSFIPVTLEKFTNFDSV